MSLMGNVLVHWAKGMVALYILLHIKNVITSQPICSEYAQKLG